MIDAALATQLAGLVAPFLPKLMDITTKAGNKAMESLGERVGEGTWNKAICVWNILRPQVEKEPEVAKVLQDAANKPNDPRVGALISWQLEKLTFSFDTLVELQRLVNESKSEVKIVTAKDGSVAAGENMTNNIIWTNNSSSDKKTI